MDAQRLSLTPPGARADTHRGGSRGSRPSGAAASAPGLNAASRRGAVVATRIPAAARTEAQAQAAPALCRFPGRWPAGPTPKTQVGSP